MKEAKILHGKINSLALMSDYAMGFRFHLTKLLGSFGRDENGSRLITKELKDLEFWDAFLEAAKKGLPLCKAPKGVPVLATEFV